MTFLKSRTLLMQPLFSLHVGPIYDVSRQLPSTSTGEFPHTPSIKLISESDPARAFSPPQPPAAGEEPLSTLTVSEGQQLKEALLQSIVKCMQIQNSLYRLVLVKLQAHITADGQTGSQRSCTSDSPEAPSTERPTAASLNLGEARGHPTEDAESLYDDPKYPTMKSARDSVAYTPESLSSGKSLNYFPKASGLNSAGCSLNEIPKAQSRESLIETSRDDVSEVPSGESTEETPNEAKATATESSEENLRDFLKAPLIEECAEKCPMASVTLGTPYLGGPERNPIDVPETSRMDRPQDTLNDVRSALLCELEKPLEALMHCTNIQTTLFQRLISLNLIATEGATDSSGDRNPFGDDDLSEMI